MSAVFGQAIFGQTIFGSLGADKLSVSGNVWVDICSKINIWDARAQESGDWGNQDKKISDWDARAPESGDWDNQDKQSGDWGNIPSNIARHEKCRR